MHVLQASNMHASISSTHPYIFCTPLSHVHTHTSSACLFVIFTPLRHLHIPEWSTHWNIYTPHTSYTNICIFYILLPHTHISAWFARHRIIYTTLHIHAHMWNTQRCVLFITPSCTHLYFSVFIRTVSLTFVSTDTLLSWPTKFSNLESEGVRSDQRSLLLCTSPPLPWSLPYLDLSSRQAPCRLKIWRQLISFVLLQCTDILSLIPLSLALSRALVFWTWSKTMARTSHTLQEHAGHAASSVTNTCRRFPKNCMKEFPTQGKA